MPSTYPPSRRRPSRRAGGSILVLLLPIAVVVGLVWKDRAGEETRTGAGFLREVTRSESYLIERKVMPGGSLTWHQSETDPWTRTPRVARQASSYYFICREQGTGAAVIFEVPKSRFDLERVGNRLTSRQVSDFRRVDQVEEPPAAPGYRLDRRDSW